MNIDLEQEKYLNPEKMEHETTTNTVNRDLDRYLKDLFKGIPDEKEKQMILQNINTYYDSLNTLLIKYA